MRTIHFVTGNRGKFLGIERTLREFSLPVKLEQTDIELIEPQANSVAEVAAAKAAQAWEKLQKPLIVEDSGLFVDALHGLPGPYVKYAVTTLGAAKFASLIPPGQPRTCNWVSVLVYMDETGTAHTFEDVAEKGLIAEAPCANPEPEMARSEFWRIYMPQGWDKPLAALNPEEYAEFRAKRTPYGAGSLFARWLSEAGSSAA